MSKLVDLLTVTTEEKRAILKEFEMSEKEFEKKVKELKEWREKRQLIPKDSDDNKLILCLLNNKMNLEKAKKSVEAYYTIRALFFEELFGKLVPNTRIYQEAKALTVFVAFPRLTPDLCRIIYLKIRDPEGTAISAFSYMITCAMFGELSILTDFYLSHIIIIDMEDVNWRNFIKFTPSVNYKLLTMMNSFRLRLKNMHIINASPVMTQIAMKFLTVLLPSKVSERIRWHQDYTTLHEYISKDYLPENLGGTQKSTEYLYEDWCDVFEQLEPLFKELLAVKLKKPVKLNHVHQNLLGLGAEGSFKQLAID